MSDQSVSVTLTAKVAGFIAGMRAAESATSQAMGNVGKYVDKNSASISRMSTTVGLVGVAMVGAAAVSVKAWANYSAKMAQVQALTHATASQMDVLKASSMSFATQFGISASQAADAELELVKAGVSVADITGGALKGALTLAAAGQLDVADATSIAASAMTQFGLKGKDVPHIADLLAAGADRALGSVQDLGQGLKYVGPVAHSMGVSIDSTVGVLSEFAQNGILADQAGTSLRGVMQALTSPSAVAAKTMKQYGISLFDTQGKFKGLAGLAGQLQTKLGGLTQAQQAAALGQIFGNRQITAATILMQGGAAQVNKWTKTVNDQGFAAEQAGGKLGSLSGDLTKLKASFTNDLINMGASADGPLRGVVQRVTGVTSAFGNMSKGAKTALLVISGGGGLIALGAAGLGKLVVSVRSVQTALSGMGVSAKTAGLAFGGIGLVLTAATLGLTAWAEKQAKTAAEVSSLTDALDQQTGAITDNYTAIISKSISSDKVGSLFGFGGTNVSDLASRMGISLGQLEDGIVNQGKALDVVKGKIAAYSATADESDESAKKLTGYINDQTKVVDQSKEAWKAANEAQNGTAETQDDAATAALKSANALKKYNSVISAQEQQEKSASAALSKWAGTVSQSGSAFIDLSKNVDASKTSLQDWVKQIQDQEKAEESWNSNLEKIATRGGSKTLIDALSKLGPAGAQMAKELANGPIKNIKALNKAYQDGTLSAQQFDKFLEKQYGPKLKPIKLTVDTTQGEAALEALTTASDDASGTMTIKADGTSATRSLDHVTASVDKTRGTVTILGKDDQALGVLHDYTVTIDKTTGHVIVSGTDSEGRKVVTDFKSWTDAQGAAIKITADTRAAVAAGIQIRAMLGQPINIGVSSTAAIKAGKKARGGKVIGPGTGTSDTAGLYALSNGEHVLTASDVTKMGGQQAVYAFRAGLQSGIKGYASGGAIYKGHSLAYWQDKTADRLAVAQMRQSIKDDKDALKETEKYGPKDKHGKQHETRYVLRGIDRTVGRDQLKADEKALSDALYANKLNDSKKGTIAHRVNEQAKAATKKSNAAAAAKTEKGNVVNAVGSDDPTDSRADALSLASTARTEAKKSGNKTLAKEADKATESFKKLYAQSAKIEKSLAAAKDKLANLKSIASDTKSSIKDAFDLSSAYHEATDATTTQVEHKDASGDIYYTSKTTAATKAGYSKSAILSAANGEAKDARAFATGLKKLQAKLGSGPAAYAIIQQAMSAFGDSPEQGVEFVNALNSMSKSQLSTLKSDYSSISSAGTSAGNSVADADSKGGIAAANKSANDLAASLKKVNTQIGKIGTTLDNAMLKPYGLKVNSKGQVVKRALGGWVTGAGTSTSDSIHLAASNGEFVVNAKAAQANAALLERINSTATYVGPTSPASVARAATTSTASSSGANVSFNVNTLNTDAGVDQTARAFIQRTRDVVNAYGLSAIGATP